MLALVNGRPQTLSLKACLRQFLDFRREVVTRRTIYDLRQARARAHILEGFEIALDNLDAIIALIRASENTADARAQLMAGFELSERQAQAILDMRLRALTSMERQRVMDELAEIRARIADFEGLLANDSRILEVVIDEAREVHEKFSDERRTEITGAVVGISTEDLIVEEDMVVTLSHQGYNQTQCDNAISGTAPRWQGRKGDGGP